MGPIAFACTVSVLALCAILAARLKSRVFRPTGTRYEFKPVRLESGPTVSVVIPARNEEHNLAGLLEGVISQRYGPLEIVIVDDASTDGTLDIASSYADRDSRISIVRAQPVPKGWTGKNNALAEGVKATSGEYILFLDCDVRLHSDDVVGGLVDYARGLGLGLGLYSVIPEQKVVGAAERLFGPAVYTVMGLAYMPLKNVNDPKHPKAAAVGQCLFFNRIAYDEIGGHEAVKQHIAEDIEFARLVKAAGLGLGLSTGDDSLSVRMYRSFGEIWQGWSKHIYRSAVGGFGGLVATELAFLLAFVAPTAILLWALWLLWAAPGVYGAIAALAAFGVAGFGSAGRVKAYRRMGWPVRYEPVFPLAMILALALLVASAIGHHRPGGLRWKDRKYSADELKI